MAREHSIVMMTEFGFRSAKKIHGFYSQVSHLKIGLGLIARCSLEKQCILAFDNKRQLNFFLHKQFFSLVVSFGFIPLVSTRGIFFYVTELRLFFYLSAIRMMQFPGRCIKKIHSHYCQVGHLKFGLCLILKFYPEERSILTF